MENDIWSSNVKGGDYFLALLNTTEYQKTFDSLVSSWRLLLYIKDNAGKFVDFSDRVEDGGKNLLADVGNISLVAESREGTGSTSSKPIRIKLLNKDRFFNKLFPTLTTIDGATASFSTSSNKKHTILYNHEAQILCSVTFKDGRTEEGIVSTYTIGSISFSKMSPFISMELRDKSLSLRSQDSAERVKDGLNYWENRDIPFLLRETLASRYNDSTGVLPTTFIIPDRVRIQSAGALAGDSGDQRVVSHYGRMPEKDDANTYFKKGLVCRAIVVAVQPSDLSSADDPTFPGGLTADNVYMGCDDELWVWDPVNEQSTKIDDSTLGSTNLIRRLWYSIHQNKVYGVAYSIKTSPTTGTDHRHEDVKVFKYDGTSLTVIATLSDVYTTEFCYRVGRTVSSENYIGQFSGSSNDSGENIPLSYGQRIIAMDDGDSFVYDKVDKIFDPAATIIGKSNLGEEDLAEGYYPVKPGLSGVNTDTIRFSLGQQGFFVFHSRSTTNIYLWFSQFRGAGTDEVDIRRINLKTGTTQTNIFNYRIGGNVIHPLCGTFKLNSNNIFIGGIFWDDASGTSNVSNAFIQELNPDNFSQTTRWDSSAVSSSEEFFTPLEIHHDLDSGNLYCSFFSRNKLGKTNAFVFARRLDTASSSTDWTIISERRNQLKGFILSGGELFMFENGTGKYLKIDVDSDTFVTLDDGFPAVDGEYGLSVPDLAVDETPASTIQNIIYGVSSPTPLLSEAYDFVPNGLYYFFKLDEFYSGRVPLYKTEGMDKWTAMQFLSQMANYKMGFNRPGDFYFVENSVASTVDETFRLDDTNKRIIDIVVTTGEREVYNLVRISPFSVFLSPIQFEMSLVTRPEIISDDEAETPLFEKPFDGEIQIQQKDNRRKTLTLEATTSGKVSLGEVSFRYRSTDEKFETTLIAAASVSATTIRVSSGLDHVKAGDTVKLEGGGNKEEKTVDTTPTDAEKETGTITLADGLTNAYSIGDFVEVTNNLSTWSDEVDNLVTDSFFQNFTSGELDDWTESSGDIDASLDATAGNFIYGKHTALLTMDTPGSDTFIYQDILASEFTASAKYTVVAQLRCFEGDGSTLNRTDSMQIKITGAGAIVATVSVSSRSLQFAEKSVTFTMQSSPTGNVRIEIHIKGVTDATPFNVKGWVDGCIVKKGLVAQPDFIVASSDQFMPIGNSNVEFKLVPQSVETRVLASDRLIIQCPGLDLRKEENSIQTNINTTSRGLYGEIPYPEINNPYLSRSLARDVSKRILNEFAFPKYILKLIAPFMPFLDFINSNNKVTSITTFDESTFGASGSWSEKGQIKSISDNMRSGMTTISLRSTEKE